MACQFSKDGKYFAQLSNDGKLKIWHTTSNKFIQEFTPDVHLTAPCNCLHFIQSKVETEKTGTPRKKVKRRNSVIEDTYTLALGTSSGTILFYSIDKAALLDTITSDTNYNITCLTHQDDDNLYAGAEQYVLQCSLSERVISQKWKSGNEEITAILKIPSANRLLTAARLIKLWDIDTKQLLKSFTGHKSEITIMDYVSPQVGQSYIISGSKSDRTLSCWNLSEDKKNKNAVATFLLEDTIRSLNVMTIADGTTYIAVSVLNGAMHVFEHILNGKCTKPIKPKTTVKIASTNPDKNGQVKPILILSGYLLGKCITIAYGSAISLTFESIALDLSEKAQCLIRHDSSIKSKHKDKKANKTAQVIEPISDNVTYLTPHTAIKKAAKRQKDGGAEIAMEKRLENLTVAAGAFNASTTTAVSETPQMNNVAQLLVQGLHSEDKEILSTVLCGQRYKDEVISNTVRRLKMPVIQLLIAELVKMLQSRTNASQTGAVWLKHILHCHSGLLLANAELADLLSPALNAIQSRLTLALPVQRLQGRLNLLMSQIEKRKSGERDGAVDEEVNHEALLVYDDKAISDDDLATMDVTGAGSDSDMEEWNEDDVDSNIDDDDDADNTGVTKNGQNVDESDVEDVEDEDMSS